MPNLFKGPIFHHAIYWEKEVAQLKPKPAGTPLFLPGYESVRESAVAQDHADYAKRIVRERNQWAGPGWQAVYHVSIAKYLARRWEAWDFVRAARREEPNSFQRTCRTVMETDWLVTRDLAIKARRTDYHTAASESYTPHQKPYRVPAVNSPPDVELYDIGNQIAWDWDRAIGIKTLRGGFYADRPNHVSLIAFNLIVRLFGDHLNWIRKYDPPADARFAVAYQGHPLTSEAVAVIPILEYPGDR